jgi:hypothetical protein
MRGDQQTINGLLAYVLGIAQTSLDTKVATLAATPAIESTLRPTSDSSVGFPVIYPTTPTTHYDKVDEAVPNDDSDYIRTDTGHLVTKTDKYLKTSFTLPAGKKIAGVLISARVKTEYITSARQARAWIGVDVGGVNYMSGILQTLDAWQTKTYWFEKNPATGLAWTQADVNNAKIVVQGATYTYDVDDYWMYCSTVWLDVYTYTDATVYYSISVWKRDSGGTETLIATNIAQWSALISALHDAAGLKFIQGSVPFTSMVSTDSIVVRVYQKVGAGSWTLVQTWTTEQLGAQSLSAYPWNLYYYLKIAASTSAVNSEYWFGNSSYDSKIGDNSFMWTPAPPPAGGILVQVM